VLPEDYELEKTNDTLLPIEIDENHRKILINEDSPLMPRSKNQKELSQLAGIAFEISMQAEESDRRKRFYDLLSKLLSL